MRSAAHNTNTPFIENLNRIFSASNTYFRRCSIFFMFITLAMLYGLEPYMVHLLLNIKMRRSVFKIYYLLYYRRTRFAYEQRSLA